MINQKEIQELGLQLFEDTYFSPEEDLEMKWDISEADQDPTGVVDGISILGRAVGPFFVVDGESQNQRFYSRDLWERILKESQETIKKGAMLCTIGHGQPIDDAALLEGKVSHRISKLWIQEGKGKPIGMGEMLILNTPAGRTLNTYMRSGMELPVSSRGYGKYSGTTESGCRIVDSATYKLEGFDVVRVPGIPTAIPILVEARDKDEGVDGDDKDKTKKSKSDDKKSTPPFIKTDKDKSADAGADDEKDDKDDKKSEKSKDVEKDSDDKENKKGKDKDDGANDDEKEESLRQVVVAQLKSEEVITKRSSPQVEQRKVYKMEDNVLSKMTEEKIRLEENLRQALETNSRLQETISALKGQVDEYHTALTGYRQLGSTEDISRVMDVTETMLHNRPVEESDFVTLRETLDIYEELGTPEELEQLFDKFDAFMNQYEELGTPGDLNQALDSSAALLEGYSDLGSPTDINEAFDSVETFMGEMSELGTVAEIHGVCDLLEAYQEFGTPSELKRVFGMMNALVDNTTQSHIKNEGRTIAAEYGVDATIAESLVKSMGSVEARKTLGAINESRGVATRYVAPATTKKNEGRGQSGALNESVSTEYSALASTLFSNTPTSRATRLFDKMGR